MANKAEHSSRDHSDMLPKDWPGAFDLYKYSKNAVYFNWQTILVLYLVMLVLGAATYPFPPITGNILSFIISAVGTVALTITIFGSFKGKAIEIGHAISASWPYVINMLILQILVAITCVASLIAFIIPFFFIAPRFAIASYYVVDKKMGAIEAYKASWNDTRGHVSKVYGIVGVSILMALLLITVIGIPFALYLLFFYSGAFAILYKHVVGHQR